MGTAYGDEPFEYSTERAYGTGATRDDAYYKAYSDCTSLMTMAATLAMSAGKKRDGGTCTVAECSRSR
jgi:hypothetical protein